MTGSDMTTYGLAVYGFNWKSALARKLGISSSVVDRWSKDIGLPQKAYTQAVVANKLKRVSW